MKKLLFLTFFFAFRQVFPQIFKEPVFHHLNASKLDVKSTASQCWDKNGKMWGIYEGGIFSYDGFSTQKWTCSPSSNISLLSKAVQGLYMDKNDFLWFGYSDTLAVTRFDTKTNQITHFRPKKGYLKSVPESIITGFKEDSKGNLWIMSWGSGFGKIDRITGECLLYAPQKPVSEESKGFINRVKDIQELPDGRYMVVYFSNEGLPYLPSYFDPVKETFEDFPLEDYLKKVDTLLAKNVRKAIKIGHFLHVDNDNNFWFGTYSGLLFFDNKNKTIQRVSGAKDLTKLNLDNTRGYEIDENGLMWVSTPYNGIMIVNKTTKKVNYVKRDSRISFSLADNRIKHLKKDNDGNIWISVGIGGFSIYNPIVQKFKLIEWKDLDLEFSNRSDQKIPVNQILVDLHSQIYISGESGIFIYNTDSDKVVRKIDPGKRRSFGLKNNNSLSRINDISFINENKLLITSPNFPAVYDLKKDEIRYFDSTNLTLKERRVHYRILFRHQRLQNKPLVFFRAFQNYLFKADTNSFQLPIQDSVLINRSPSGGYSYVMANGKWLIPFGEKEFLIFDPKTKAQKLYGYHNKENFFPDSIIKMAYLDKEDIVWFGTDKGLYRFDANTGKSEYMNPKMGLGSEPVFAISKDKNGVFWMALEKELLKWDPKNNSVLKIGSELGLSAGSFIGAMAQTDEKERIYIATFNGALVFDPASINIPMTPPKLHLNFLNIKEDTLNNEKLNEFASGKAELKWNENFLTLDFGTSQVYTPVPHHFYYRIIGLDSVWQDNGISNRVRFTNLSSGNYTLQVIIKNCYAVTSETLSIPFKIKPPFWLTWWFYLIMAILLFVGGRYYLKYREKAFIKKQEILEEKIRERTAEVVAKAKEIEMQKDIILEKNKELTDSIYYAQRIQQSILPDEAQIKRSLENNFVFFRPKDIVSGDFYWFSKQDDSVLWAVVDCTGHGVPGGFMSMLGSGLLNQIVNEEGKLQPNEILNQLRDRVIIALKQTGEIGENKDGMDITLCRYIPSKNKLQVAAANNPLYIIRQNEMIEVKADKQPIGIYLDERKPFILHEVDLQKDDVLYLTSDGFADQFGGPKGKKFKTSNFEKLMVEIGSKPLSEQAQIINNTFYNWKGQYDQLDDVCVMVVKI